MSSNVKNEGWPEKSTLKSSGALGGVGVLALLFAFFKIRPYLGSPPTVRAYNATDSAKAQHSGQTVKKPESATFLDSFTRIRGVRFTTGTRSGMPKSPVRIIERPLFDGLPVLVSARLARGISSLEPDLSTEADFVALIRTEETQELDDESMQGAKLMGVAVPNLDLKRMVLHFSEIVTREGRHYAVQATAIDPETQTQGVPADYSSGLPSRLAGVGISRVLTAADQILMAKLLPDPGRASIVQQATQEAARQLNDEAANDISLEATRNLRETKAELSLAVGTSLTLRLRALTEQPMKE